MPATEDPRTPDIPFTLTLLTRDPAWAAAADAAGIGRVGIDIERLGKRERQSEVPDARISDHTLEDLSPVAKSLHRARAFVRINPFHEGTREEIETALRLGARSIMLPQLSTATQAREFADMIAGRAETLLLLETGESLSELDAILAVPGVDEVMVGPNDLSLALGMSHPMHLIASPVLEDIAARAKRAGRPFGFGGVAGPDVPSALPVPPDLVLARHAALGSCSAWIARSFHEHLTPETLGDGIRKLRERLHHWFTRDREELDAASEALRVHISQHRPGALPAP